MESLDGRVISDSLCRSVHVLVNCLSGVVLTTSYFEATLGSLIEFTEEGTTSVTLGGAASAGTVFL